MASPLSLTLTRPDDWHLHLRDGAAMAAVLPASARQFARAIVMPNLKPPVVTAAQALEYRGRIVDALPAGSTFTPLMTLYLTDTLAPAEIVRAKAAGVVAVKLYPAGATTHSDAGVTDMRHVSATLRGDATRGLAAAGARRGHRSHRSTCSTARRCSSSALMQPLRRDFPALKIVFEHITTREAAQYVADGDANTAATITAHHLLYNRNAIFTGGIAAALLLPAGAQARGAPPALSRRPRRAAPKFFLGTDSAPHAAVLEGARGGCAGCYTAPAALELYAEAFEAAGALDQLEAFASFNGAGLLRPAAQHAARVTLRREPGQLPDSVPFGDAELKPLRGGETLAWRLAAEEPPWITSPASLC